jgi:hypothetical protein
MYGRTIREETGQFMFRSITLACVVPVALAMAGCVSTKSADPLSPTVAGPIPGVNITPPGIMKPATGTKIAVDQQPLVLTVLNAGTSGVRPLTYLFEVAADVSFANKVFTQEGIQPGESGQTSLRLPDALATGRTYFWHARAQDSANTGPFSSTAAFDVFTPIVIGARVPASPINAIVDLRTRALPSPTRLIWTGGCAVYVIEIADSAASATGWRRTVGERGQSFSIRQDLPPIKGCSHVRRGLSKCRALVHDAGVPDAGPHHLAAATTAGCPHRTDPGRRAEPRIGGCV